MTDAPIDTTQIPPPLPPRRMFYSPSRKGFYPSDVLYPDPPTDLIEVALDQYNALMAAQATGKAIAPDTNGAPQAVEPASLLTLAQKRFQQAALASTTCQASIVGGFKSSALGALYTYPSTMIDQQNLSANVLSSMLPGLPGNWSTMQMCADANNVWAYRPHSAAQIQQVGQDGKARIVACLIHNATLAATIAAASDPLSVDVTQGWPA